MTAPLVEELKPATETASKDSAKSSGAQLPNSIAELRRQLKDQIEEIENHIRDVGETLPEAELQKVKSIRDAFRKDLLRLDAPRAATPEEDAEAEKLRAQVMALVAESEARRQELPIGDHIDEDQLYYVDFALPADPPT